jgi:hypothetical protein
MIIRSDRPRPPPCRSIRFGDDHRRGGRKDAKKNKDSDTEGKGGKDKSEKCNEIHLLFTLSFPTSLLHFVPLFFFTYTSIPLHHPILAPPSHLCYGCCGRGLFFVLYG